MPRFSTYACQDFVYTRGDEVLSFFFRHARTSLYCSRVDQIYLIFLKVSYRDGHMFPPDTHFQNARILCTSSKQRGEGRGEFFLKQCYVCNTMPRKNMNLPYSVCTEWIFESWPLGWHCFTKSQKPTWEIWFSHSLDPKDSKKPKFDHLEGRLVVLARAWSLWSELH